MFLCRIVRKFFWSEREEATEACRKLWNEALYALYLYQMIKSKSVRLAGHVACVETLSNQNAIHEEIKSPLKPGNACCHSVQNLLSISLLSKNTNIKIYRTTNLSLVLYESKTLSFKLREEHKLMVPENRVLKRIFRP